MEESSEGSSEEEDHPATPAGMSMLQTGLLDHNNIPLFCINANILKLYTVILDIIRHVHNFISHECFPGEEPVTRRMKGTSEQQLGQKRSSGGKNVASLLSVLSFHMYV